MLKPARASERGAVLVETAMVLLVLLATICFVLDMGHYLLVQQYSAERARAAARMAAVNNWNQSQVANYYAYGATTAPAGGTVIPGVLGLLPSQVEYTTIATAGSPAYCVRVRVSGIPAILYTPFLSGNYVLPAVTVSVPAQSLGATN